MTLEAGLTHDLSWDTGHTLSMLTGIGVQPGGLEVQVLCPPGDAGLYTACRCAPGPGRFT